jgi:hypothetical protein
MDPREALTREALRLHGRYQRELVERFSVCPWAKPARTEGRVHAHVVTEAPCSVEAFGSVVARWAADETVDVAFVILPLFDEGPDALSELAAAIGDRTDEVFLTAPFHPISSPGDGIVPFLRQTPDPTVQLVRRTTLEAIRAQDPPHYKDIFDLDLRDLEAKKAPRSTAASVFAHNERMLEREGRARVQAIVDDIRGDRERSYAPIILLL